MKSWGAKGLRRGRSGEQVFVQKERPLLRVEEIPFVPFNRIECFDESGARGATPRGTQADPTATALHI
ncbi:hypothetical protein JTE90_019239 [Oedothorax gibbosus]|uniref:Uncharacterized protein n=1 Tax=Oedothorax gibbosus TaxID=931172 RepID=A0AAV6UTB5_9ARAC|nr:hypothetical protein JTE90_019239 [Oedothorax gibbosus]